MRVLIADDDRTSRRMLVRLLEEGGYEVVVARDGEEAWNILQREGQDLPLVVADWMMPGLTGPELVQKIRGANLEHYVYTILLTSRAEADDRIRGLAQGADDYVVKPPNKIELLHRVGAGKRVVELQMELAEKNAILALMVDVDGLTQIRNRRAFDRQYKLLIEGAERHPHPFALLMIDIDRFKSYNDCFGHAKGDGALKTVATLLDQHLRGIDSVYRYGGEEFACLLPNTGTEGARRVAERLCKVVENEEIPHPTNESGWVTISIGVAAFENSGDTPASKLLECADRALYCAKEGGRNRVCIAEVPDPVALVRNGDS